MNLRLILISVAVLILCSFAQAQLSWTTNNPLPSGKRQMAVASGGTRIYVLGGRTGANNSGNEVYLGTAGTNGTLTWQTLTALPGQRTAGAAAVYNGKLYMWGGWDENWTTFNSCFYATINGDGTIGAWQTSANHVLDQGGAAYGDSFGGENMIFNGHLYVVNGENNNGNPYQEAVQFCTINGTTGDYGVWANTNEPTDTATWFHNIAFYHGASFDYIYKICGTSAMFSDSATAVHSTTINSDGSLGAWGVQTGTLPAGKSEAALARANNKIYVMGGTNDASITGTNTVYVGTIDPGTGAVTWATDSSTLPANRCRCRGTAYEDPSGNLYIACIGGRLADANPAEATVFTAKVGNAGVENWSVY